MNRFRALWRIIYAIFYTCWIVGSIMFVSFIRGYRPGFSMNRRRKWARNLLKGIGVNVVVEGALPTTPCLIMCNHRSSIDPLLILRDVIAYPVSKAEVEKWPVLGYGAKVTGILFLKRESMTSRRQTLGAIAETIKNEQYPVFIYPEGTTSDQVTTGPFKRGGFQLAAQESIEVVPVAMDFEHTELYWIGNTPFITHFMKNFGAPKVNVRIRYGNPVTNGDPVLLQQTVQSWIDHQLLDPQFRSFDSINRAFSPTLFV